MSSKWVPDPELLPIVKRAWQMRASGASYGQIKKATQLFRSINSFSTFFRNKLFIGILDFGGTTIENYCDPIIDIRTWDAVQLLNHKNKRSQHAPSQYKTKSLFVLSGLLVCGLCSSPFSGTSIRSQDGKIYPYYRCTQRNRNRDCQAKSIPQRTIEGDILKIIQNNLLTPQNIRNIQKTDAETLAVQNNHHQTETKALKSQHGPLKRQINNLVSAIAASGHSQALLEELEELETRGQHIQAQITTLEQELQTPPPANTLTPTEISAHLLAALANAAPAEQRLILNSFITRITAQRTADGKITGAIEYHHPPEIKKKAPDGGKPHLANTSHPGGGTSHTHKF